MSSSLLFSRRVLLGGDGAPWRLVPAAIEVAAGRIVALHDLADRPGLEAIAAARGASLVDYGDHAVTPALVNAHTHLALSFLRGERVARARHDLVAGFYFNYERHLAAEDVRAFARMGAYESVLGGVGLVWDHYYHGLAVADALLDVGLAGVVAPTLQDLAGPGAAAHDDALAATEQLARSRSHAERGVFAALGPHATDTVSEGLWRRALDLAAAEALPLHAHAAQSFAEVEATRTRTGSTPARWLIERGLLERLPSAVLAHLLFTTEDELRALGGHSATAAFCPHSQRQFAFPADVRVFDRAGLPWLVATDCAAGNDSLNLQKELRAAAEAPVSAVAYGAEARDLQHAEPPAYPAAAQALERARRAASEALLDSETLLRRVTTVPGALHPACRAGVLAAGALANLVVWDLDHPSFWPQSGTASLVRSLVFGDTTQAIYASWIAGRRIGRDGDFHRSLTGSPEYRSARAEAEERLRRLNARLR